MQVHTHITDTAVRLFSTDTLKLVAERNIADLPPGTDINTRIKDWADVLQVEVVSIKRGNKLVRVADGDARISVDKYSGLDDIYVHLYMHYKNGTTSLYLKPEEAREVVMAMNLALANIA
jgi:hypothetical protein